MIEKTKIAVFASGSGSNFVAIEEACRNGELNAEIAVLITDKPEAYVAERARELNIPISVFSPKAYGSREKYEEAILQKLEEDQVEWLILAGYMRLIGHTLLDAFPSRIVNIHPSLLPSFPGKAAIEQAIEHGVKVTGVTVHLVDEGMDTGPILAQEAVRVVDGDVNQTAEAIHAVEHVLYKETLHRLFTNQ
ncbi:phosphoribosylglycinamide formyltransferase [Sporosarcina pasteurii]|uniref:Phosphoribosylglycinamide formyltransferase n=1 Tax=Sporosarcina pasteurii TaxID=1474 RepID=A0A380CBX2_SPOPA|nr:phosphoribosylglycinamide formyltransferase [Sporosarcina pasteurii]MDS9473156.1 phosphoribosylglycinamide formyltransferase [Sporosarcina pasteurii]QBQ06991.1 phosphoribosylglycinamide formyltransferase [Sporosarcina pasteurii]SUJ17501.1 Phosphoribosylglycinamide formyltransferase [Sporosarcina pasteurii]